MARQAMGPCVVTSLYEGLAHFLQGTWRGMDPLVSAALLQESGALPAVGALLDELHQLRSGGRCFRMVDYLHSLCGISLALLFLRYYAL